MEDCEWMYTGRASQGQVTNEWIDKTDAFLERAFGVTYSNLGLVKIRHDSVLPGDDVYIMTQ